MQTVCTRCGAGHSHEPPQLAVGVSAEPPEELAHVADQEVGHLHGSEVTATVELGPVHDVVGLLGETPDRWGDLAGKTAIPVGTAEVAGGPQPPEWAAS